MGREMRSLGWYDFLVMVVLGIGRTWLGGAVDGVNEDGGAILHGHDRT